MSSAESGDENGNAVWRISKKQRSPEFANLIDVLNRYNKQQDKAKANQAEVRRIRT